MNLLERAKSFVAGKASRIAMTVVPLAALTVIAVPASATRIAPVTFSPGTCAVSFGTGSCSAGQTAATGGNTSANWIGVSSNTISATSAGNGTEVQLSETGSASSSFFGLQNLPVSWDFFINNPGNSGGGTVNWDVLFSVQTAGGTFSVDPFGFDSVNGPVEIKGSTNIAIPSTAGTVSGFQVRLTATDANADIFTVMVPAGATLDLNPSAPEPSSLILAGAGLAGLLWRRKTKQA